MTIEIDENSAEVKSLLIKNKEDSEVEKEDQTVEDMQIEESEEKSGLEREKKLKVLLEKKIKTIFSMEEKIAFVLKTFKVVTYNF